VQIERADGGRERAARYLGEVEGEQHALLESEDDQRPVELVAVGRCREVLL
jgi:hypothetical protein